MLGDVPIVIVVVVVVVVVVIVTVFILFLVDDQRRILLYEKQKSYELFTNSAYVIPLKLVRYLTKIHQPPEDSIG